MILPRITALEKTFATGCWNDLFIGVWRGPALVAAANEWGRQYEHMAMRHSTGFLAIGIVEPQTPIPDALTRKALAAAMDRAGGAIRAMAGVQEASGFAGATLRSILLALSNMSSSAYPRRMFGSCGEAALWLAPHFTTAKRVTAPEIVAAITQFRALLDPQRGYSTLDGRVST